MGLIRIEFDDQMVVEILAMTTNWLMKNNDDLTSRESRMLTPVVLEHCSRRALQFLSEPENENETVVITTGIQEIIPTGEEEDEPR